MEYTVSATEARIHFGELMRRVVEGRKPIVVERGGKPQVVVLSIEAYERLLEGQQQQDDWQELVRRARAQIEADLGGRTLPPAEEILQQVRRERGEQLVALR